jgi:CBS domain-containing protein
MKSVEEIEARDLMNEDPETVTDDRSIGSIKDFLEESDLRTVPVVSSEGFEGAISYRELIRHIQYNPKSSKLKKVIHRPPKFDKTDSLVDVAELRIQSGRKMIVNLKDGELEGVISDDEFLEVADGIEEFDNYSTSNLATSELVEVFEDDPLDKARHLMLDNNISRLPVLDNEGELTGILKSTDLLKMMVPMESQGSGGTSGKNLKDTQMSGGNEKQSMSNIDVEELMDRNPPTIKGYGPTSEAVDQMKKASSNELIITENNYPEAILTVKDLIDYIQDQKQNNMVLVNLIGLDVEEEKAAVHNKIETQLRGSLGRKVESPEEISVHFKKHEKDGKRHRYEVTAKFYSEYGITTANVEDYDLLNVVDQALESINKQVRKEKGKKDDR